MGGGSGAVSVCAVSVPWSSVVVDEGGGDGGTGIRVRDIVLSGSWSSKV